MHRSRLSPAACFTIAAILLFAVVTPTLARVSAPTGTGAIAGVVFFDANGDGVRGLDEAGIAGVVVEVWDAGTGGAVYHTSITTAGNGAYQVAGLDAGSYVVTETDPWGYISTTANSQTVSVDASAVIGIDFGDTLTFTVAGIVFNDADGNGVQQPSEPGTPDVAVQVYDDSNANGLAEAGEALLGSTLTDGSGAYAIGGIRPGYRVLRIVLPAGSFFPGGDQVGMHLISTDGTETNAFYQNFPLLPVTEPAPACAYPTSIVSGFINNTAIPAGRTVWFTARLRASGLGADEVTIYFENVLVQFPANNTVYHLAVPRGKVIFSPTAATTTTAYDAATDTWVTTVSAGNLGEQVFLTGLAFPAPAEGLPGSIKPVTMSGRVAGSKAGVTLQWEWSAAVYTSFSTDYNALGVKPVSVNTQNPYNNQDIAGTPENFKAFVTAGARGNGGSNYTGNRSPAALGSCVTSATPPFVMRINCGSVTYSDAFSQVWTADRAYSLGAWGYTAGAAKSSGNAVSGTADDFLYQKYRENPGEYRITVPDDAYDVTLRFAEFAANNATERLMRISMEGVVVEPSLSVYGVVGKNAAFDKTYTVAVSDGLLVIGFARAPGASKEPVVSAIEVKTHTGAIPPTPTPTPAPTATPTPLPTATPTRVPYDQAVNCGSVSYTDGAGQVWAADKSFTSGSWGFKGGSAKTATGEVLDTVEDPLYLKYRENMDEYKFTVPNGSYEVTLKFAEFVVANANGRIMRITIERTQVEPALSIFAEAPGRYRALDRVYTVSVTDGVLNIIFAKASGSDKEPVVSAVRVRSR